MEIQIQIAFLCLGMLVGQIFFIPFYVLILKKYRTAKKERECLSEQSDQELVRDIKLLEKLVCVTNSFELTCSLIRLTITKEKIDQLNVSLSSKNGGSIF